MTKNKCDPTWVFMKQGDDDHIYNECGEKKLLTASDYHLTFGKYSGLTIAELTDEWYLTFLEGVAKEKNDWFLARCLSLRAA